MQDYRNIPGDQKRAFWENHINAWKNDHISRKAYCKIHNLNIHTFGYWVGRLKDEQKKSETGLVPISFTPPKVLDSTSPAIELVLSDSLTLIIPVDFDREHLLRVLQVLEFKS